MNSVKFYRSSGLLIYNKKKERSEFMNQIRDVVNLDTKAFIMFSDLIKQFYEVKSDALKVLDLKLSHLKILHLLSDHNGINQMCIRDSS